MDSYTCRKLFIDYFVDNKHTYVPSSSVDPADDASLLFVNAGMCQFKKIFLSIEEDNYKNSLKRAVNSQKCVRAGGKHNDLDDIGKDTYHHSFFEMLGNWSFGDYTKEVAIDLAWNCLTKCYKLDEDRLYATYFSGDEESNLAPDLDCKKIWTKYLSEDRIIACDVNNNFWEMGNVGPCGPCTEIHYDRLGNRNAATLVNKDDPNVIELWNIVFIQLNRKGDGSLEKLPKLYVDTGMGFERLLSILNNVYSNYDTDLFIPYFKKIHQLFPNLPSYKGKVGIEDLDKIDQSYRLIADHIRTVAIAISDGVMPTSEGKGYVIRRILRRAKTYSLTYMNIQDETPWLCELVSIVSDSLGTAYPNLKAKYNQIYNVICDEEKLFATSLKKGYVRYNKYLTKAANRQLDEKILFELHNTYGLPFDIIKLFCEKDNLEINEDVFEDLIEKHIKISASNFIKQFHQHISPQQISELNNNHNIPKTDDKWKYNSNFNDRTVEIISANICAISYNLTFVEAIDSIETNSEIVIITDKTNFYAEKGGQVGDTGKIYNVNFKFSVTNTIIISGYVLHIGKLLNGTIKKNDSVYLEVDGSRRIAIEQNHTCTHSINDVLRKVSELHDGSHGSSVESTRFKFDFATANPLSITDIKLLEDSIHTIIKEDKTIYKELVPYDSAKKIVGVRSFDNKDYPVSVNVISVGVPIVDLLNGSNAGLTTSVEFCGGTHLHYTSQIEAFKITVEESVSKGIRRLIGVTGDIAKLIIHNDSNLLTLIENCKNMNLQDQKLELAKIKLELSNNKENYSYITRKKVAKLIEQLTKDCSNAEKNEYKKFITLCDNELKLLTINDHKYIAKLLPFETDSFKILEYYVNSIMKLKKITVIAIAKYDTNKAIILISSNDNQLNANEALKKILNNKPYKGGGSAKVSRAHIFDINATDVYNNVNEYMKSIFSN